jgi:hypothetical protein
MRKSGLVLSDRQIQTTIEWERELQTAIGHGPLYSATPALHWLNFEDSGGDRFS